MKDLFFQVMYQSGISTPGRIRADRHLILTFHRVLPAHLRSQYPIPGLVVTPATLKWIIEALLPFFDVQTVTRGSDLLRAGGTSRPILSITFDDGQLDNFEYAAPVLDDLRVPGTFYLPTDFIGSNKLLWHDEAAFAWSVCGSSLPNINDSNTSLAEKPNAPGNVSEFLGALKSLASDERGAYMQILRDATTVPAPDWAKLMSWHQASELVARGHEIGSHSLSHELLPQLDSKAQKRELAGSLDAIALHLSGERPTSFCYPNGDFSELTKSLASEVGYKNAVTTRWGLNCPDSSAFTMHRCDMDMRRLQDRSGALSAARLAVKINGHQPGLRVG